MKKIIETTLMIICICSAIFVGYQSWRTMKSVEEYKEMQLSEDSIVIIPDSTSYSFYVR